MATTPSTNSVDVDALQQPTEFTKDLSSHKSSTTTATTTIESSEEFTLSGEMTTSEPPLQLSNLVILEDPARSVRFAEEPIIIKEEDIAVTPKKSKKNKKKDDALDAILPQDVWWSREELESIELNAMYLVKDSQQYQEEVICTVLYNKAFLTASELGKSLSEDELAEKLEDVTQYSSSLEKWTAVGHSRRGLENMVSEKAVVDAVQSRMLVLQFQKELKEGSSTQDAPKAAAQHAEFLAKRCQDTSRTSRILARMMGQADADSLATAETLCAAEPRLPEPPGRYSGDHEHMNTSERIGRSSRNRRGSLLKSVKKTIGNVFHRQSSREVNMRRIRKIQQKRQAQEEPAVPSEEFRRSFLEKLDYGEQ